MAFSPVIGITRFDLASGCAFDLWADDIPAYPVEIRDGEVWVTIQTNGAQAAERWQRRLREGMEQNLRLVQGKAIIGLLDAGTPPQALLRPVYMACSIARLVGRQA